MPTYITATELSNVPLLPYVCGARDSSSGKTEPNIQCERQNLLIPKLKPSTEKGAEIVTAKIFSFSNKKPSVNIAPLKTKNYVEGVITSNDEISVKCELNINGKVVSIQLPRSLFPEKIHYGLPINLEMLDESGFRKPLITIRKIENKSTAKIAEEFDSILNAL